MAVKGHHSIFFKKNFFLYRSKKIPGVNEIMETNNISTIATFAAIIITTLLAYAGYTVDQAQLTTVLMGVITLIIAVWSSKNPNNLKWLGNAPEPMDTAEPVLNDEYEAVDDESC